MATLKSILTAVRWYTGADPYYFTVDNRPLSDLKDRDDAIADELDRRTICIDITGQASPITNFLPAGWSVTRNALGDYTITRPSGSTSFIVTGQAYGVAGVVYTLSITATQINVNTVNMAGAAADFRFHCLVTGY